MTEEYLGYCPKCGAKLVLDWNDFKAPEGIPMVKCPVCKEP